jgi:endogenous inhibitor of DNA gyrase (YacG/DUF329 family)
MSNNTSPKCPTCDKPIEWTEDFKWRPFCCERCKLIDLGDWLDEKHRIPDTAIPSDTETN